MATFNQQGQTVHQQFNAETINFGQVATAQDFVAQLRQLQNAIHQAAQAKTLNTQQAQDADAIYNGISFEQYKAHRNAKSAN